MWKSKYVYHSFAYNCLPLCFLFFTNILRLFSNSEPFPSNTTSILNVKSSNKHILLEMVVRWEEPTHQFLKLFIFRFWKSTNFIENIIFSFPTKYIFMNELYTSSWSQVLVNYETKYNKHFEGSCELLSKQCVISIWQTVACTFLSHLICFPCTFLSHVMSIPCTFLKVVM